ncbi:MAG: SDR family oxidoreductase, partial [Alphaproteobacteria bacterium]|nr:SDR family oxidoreductase [Alphaproteobacteria bacterium]
MGPRNNPGRSVPEGENSMRLLGKVAIVTGGGSGMGRAICHVFAREGARVAVVDLDAAAAAKVAQESGSEARPFTTDVTRTDQVAAMVAAVAGHFGRIDILVNNAGSRIIKSFLDHSDADWERMIGVNLRGPFLCARAAIPHMLKAGKGKVINNASIAGVTGRPNRAAYCAAKGGLLALTRALATDMAGKNICVNAILPGSIETPFNAEF